MNHSKAQEANPIARLWRSEQSRAVLEYLYPKRLLCALMYQATRIRFGAWKNWQIRWFIRRFGVDMSIAEIENPGAYEHFNSFFTRRLKPGARPLPEDQRSLVSPADGTLYDFGNIDAGTLIQAKVHRYSVADLLADKEDASRCFNQGCYLTIYLSPRDYHRVHMPFGGRLTEMVYVPGSRFSVNPATAKKVQRLFARNERVIAWFETGIGRMAVIMVGAIFVGAIDTAWHGAVTPAAGRRVTRWRYQPPVNVPELQRGEEMGCFNMGSTVVVLFERNVVAWRSKIAVGGQVQMGQPLATFGPSETDPG